MAQETSVTASGAVEFSEEDLGLVVAALEEMTGVWKARSSDDEKYGPPAGDTWDDCVERAEALSTLLCEALAERPISTHASGVVVMEADKATFANEDVVRKGARIGVALENSKPLDDGSGLHSVRVLLDGAVPAEYLDPEAAFVHRARRIGALVDEKNKAYGDSFAKAGEILERLYPNGIEVHQYRDALGVVRVLDKLFRIATRKDAFGESPWDDVAGYGIVAGGKEKP